MRLVSTAEAAQPDDGTRRMPDLGGKTLRQALEALEPLRVDVRLAGQGRVVRQMPAAGDPLEPGAVARLTLTASGGSR
jgi:beta-lactam-binding protein with PASTA domain